METKQLGSGKARLLLDTKTPLTTQQRQIIEKAFEQAAKEFNYTGVYVNKPLSAREPTTRPPDVSP